MSSSRTIYYLITNHKNFVFVEYAIQIQLILLVIENYLYFRRDSVALDLSGNAINSFIFKKYLISHFLLISFLFS